jgi:streptogramin lyase
MEHHHDRPPSLSAAEALNAPVEELVGLACLPEARGLGRALAMAAALVAVAAALVVPARAQAAPTITEFTAGLPPDSSPLGIAAGPDGNLWFTELNVPGRIGRITPRPGR